MGGGAYLLRLMINLLCLRINLLCLRVIKKEDQSH